MNPTLLDRKSGKNLGKILFNRQRIKSWRDKIWLKIAEASTFLIVGGSEIGTKREENWKAI